MGKSNPKKKRMVLTRREFLKASAAGLAGVGTGFYLSSGPAYGQKPIRITCISIFSGRSAVLGKSVSDALNMWRDEVNAKGGVVKRKVEVKYLDSQGKIEEAVRMAREAAASKEVDLLVESCSSREAFSVKEVSRDLNLLTIATNSKTTELTADPKTFAPFHFRAAAQNLHDMAAGAKYAADFAKKNNWKKWAMIAPDYAYGRENVMYFVRFLKRYYPEAEIVTELWPKLNEPDFTPYINKIMGAKGRRGLHFPVGGGYRGSPRAGGLVRVFGQGEDFQHRPGGFHRDQSAHQSLWKISPGDLHGHQSQSHRPRYEAEPRLV